MRKKLLMILIRIYDKELWLMASALEEPIILVKLKLIVQFSHEFDNYGSTLKTPFGFCCSSISWDFSSWQWSSIGVNPTLLIPANLWPWPGQPLGNPLPQEPHMLSNHAHLTHWGFMARITDISVNWVSTGLVPMGHQAITWTKVDLLPTEHLRSTAL